MLTTPRRAQCAGAGGLGVVATHFWQAILLGKVVSSTFSAQHTARPSHCFCSPRFSAAASGLVSKLCSRDAARIVRLPEPVSVAARARVGEGAPGAGGQRRRLARPEGGLLRGQRHARGRGAAEYDCLRRAG